MDKNNIEFELNYKTNNPDIKKNDLEYEYTEIDEPEINYVIIECLRRITDNYLQSEIIHFVSVLKDNILELKITNPNCLMGKQQPALYNKMFHEPLYYNTFKIDQLDILGNLDIFVKFTNEKSDNICYAYNASFPGYALFGLSPKYTASTKYKFLSEPSQNYQENKSSIKFINNSSQDISLKLFGGIIRLGDNIQKYNIDFTDEKIFVLKAKPIVKKLKIKSQLINISDCIKDPFKYKIDYFMKFDINKHILFKITSDSIEGNYIYDTKKNIKWRLMYKNKFLEVSKQGYFLLKFNCKDQILSFIPYCDKNTKQKTKPSKFYLFFDSFIY